MISVSKGQLDETASMKKYEAAAGSSPVIDSWYKWFQPVNAQKYTSDVGVTVFVFPNENGTTTAAARQGTQYSVVCFSTHHGSASTSGFAAPKSFAAPLVATSVIACMYE